MRRPTLALAAALAATSLAVAGCGEDPLPNREFDNDRIGVSDDEGRTDEEFDDGGDLSTPRS